MTTTTEVLRRARELIATPERWTQKATARDADGLPIDSGYDGAVCFCSLGALSLIAGCGPAYNEATYALRRAIYGGIGSVTKWNDAPDRTHAEVLAAFDAAIALAEREDASP